MGANSIAPDRPSVGLDCREESDLSAIRTRHFDNAGLRRCPPSDALGPPNEWPPITPGNGSVGLSAEVRRSQQPFQPAPCLIPLSLERVTRAIEDDVDVMRHGEVVKLESQSIEVRVFVPSGNFLDEGRPHSTNRHVKSIRITPFTSPKSTTASSCRRM